MRLRGDVQHPRCRKWELRARRATADGAYVLRFRRGHAQEFLIYPPRTAALVRRWDWLLIWEGYLPLGDRISRLHRRLQTEPLDAVADHALDLRENMGLAFQTFNKMSDSAHIEVIGMQIPCRPSITADMQGVNEEHRRPSVVQPLGWSVQKPSG